MQVCACSEAAPRLPAPGSHTHRSPQPVLAPGAVSPIEPLRALALYTQPTTRYPISGRLPHSRDILCSRSTRGLSNATDAIVPSLQRSAI